MQAIEAARQAATNMTVALRAKLERQPRESSRSPMCRWIPSLSPERRHEREGHRGSPTAVQTVYKDSDTGTPLPMLTKTNYHEWSLLV
jgi:hypothetical protein